MYLGIDIGTSYTKISYLHNGTYTCLSGADGLIPTVVSYLPSTDNLYFGNLALRLAEPETDTVFFFKLSLKRDNEFHLGPYDLASIIEEFLKYLNSNYIRNRAADIEYLTLSVPNYFGLNARHLLQQAAGKVFNISAVYLIPEPLAALIAYNALNTSESISGTILSIDVGGGTTDFSFMEAASDLEEIIMETQFQIGNDAFSGAEIDYAVINNIFLPLYRFQTGQSIPERFISGKSLPPEDRHIHNRWLIEAEKLKITLSKTNKYQLHIPNFYKGFSISALITGDIFLQQMSAVYKRLRLYCLNFLKERASLLGLCTGDKWNIDYIMLQGGGSRALGVQQIIEECFPGIPVITPAASELLVSMGLCCWNQQTAVKQSSLKTIYPFDFYRESYDNTDNDLKLIKIPFDTANLELDIRGKYKILTLHGTSCSINPGTDEMALRIYEVAQGEANITCERFMGMEPVLDKKWPENEVPESINIYLNMYLSQLETDAESSASSPDIKDVPIFNDLFFKQKESLELIKKYKHINQELIEDFSEHLEERKENAHTPYENQAETIIYKLLAMLQILDNKSTGN